MEEDVDLHCNSRHPQSPTPDDPFHDRDSQYASRDSFYPAPFCSQVPRLSTNHHFHFLLFQHLSQGNEHLLSSSRIYFTLNQELFLPSSFSVHPHQERPWANTGGSQGPSRCWGYVHLLLIQGYVPGWIRFVRKDLVCVHSDGFVSCLLIWMYFYSISRGDPVHTFLYGSFT